MDIRNNDYYNVLKMANDVNSSFWPCPYIGLGSLFEKVETIILNILTSVFSGMNALSSFFGLINYAQFFLSTFLAVGYIPLH